MLNVFIPHLLPCFILFRTIKPASKAKAKASASKPVALKDRKGNKRKQADKAEEMETAGTNPDEEGDGHEESEPPAKKGKTKKVNQAKAKTKGKKGPKAK